MYPQPQPQPQPRLAAATPTRALARTGPPPEPHGANAAPSSIYLTVVAAVGSGAGARDAANPLTQFSLEVVLPPGGPLGESITVRFCDVCCRWGELRSTHLCGSTWYRHLGQLLAVIAAGGGR